VLESRLAFMRTYRGARQAALSRQALVAGAWLRWCFWRLVAAVRGRGDTRIEDQIERFRAVVVWNRERPA
jgi:hypothetical protein